MAEVSRQFRILAFRYSDSLRAARLRAVSHEKHGARSDLVLDYDEQHLTAPSRLSNEAGKILKHVRAEYRPRRLRFLGVSELECSGLHAHLEDVPLEHDARSLRGVLFWAEAGKPARWGVFHGSPEPAELMLSARRCRQEERPGPVEPVELVRDWSPAPPMPARRLALHKQVQERFGGDPITVRLAGEAKPRRLFVGGLSEQTEQRPAVDAVLNLGDEPSRWTASQPDHASDRRARKGEGSGGMSPDEIAADADWVIERLQGGQRVLVHCSGGTNRSVTVCCGVLIRLEDLSAEAALARVREHHPWALPDTHHWLALRWLAVANPKME